MWFSGSFKGKFEGGKVITHTESLRSCRRVRKCLGEQRKSPFAIMFQVTLKGLNESNCVTRPYIRNFSLCAADISSAAQLIHCIILCLASWKHEVLLLNDHMKCRPIQQQQPHGNRVLQLISEYFGTKGRLQACKRLIIDLLEAATWSLASRLSITHQSLGHFPSRSEKTEGGKEGAKSGRRCIHHF